MCRTMFRQDSAIVGADRGIQSIKKFGVVQQPVVQASEFPFLLLYPKSGKSPKSGKKLGFFVARIFKLFSKIARYWILKRSLNQRSSAALIKLPIDNTQSYILSFVEDTKKKSSCEKIT